MKAHANTLGYSGCHNYRHPRFYPDHEDFHLYNSQPLGPMLKRSVSSKACKNTSSCDTTTEASQNLPKQTFTCAITPNQAG
jgi:hypothetical protein